MDADAKVQASWNLTRLVIISLLLIVIAQIAIISGLAYIMVNQASPPVLEACPVCQGGVKMIAPPFDRNKKP